MKKIFLLLVIVLVATAGRKERLAEKIVRLADTTVENADKYTQEQWDKVSAQFDGLLKEYKERYDSFTPEERARINKAIGRFSKAATVHGATKVSNSINEFMAGVGGKLDDFFNQVGGFFE